MRLAATLLVRDEEEILHAHLDYHLAQGVDLFLVMDNGSVDATPEILGEYERAGAVRVVPGAEPGQYRQGEWVTTMARLAATEHGADWVLNLDADEFWWPRAGTLPDALAAVPDRYGVLHAARIDFDPVPDGDEPFWERMTVRRRVLRTPLGNRGLPRVAHRGDPRIEVVTGNHAAFAPDLLLAPPVDVIDALHYPTRSLAQLERKVAAHAENIRATPGLKPDIGEENISLDDQRRRGELAGYFARQLIDAPARAAGLKDGWLVEDRRLAGFFAAGLERRAAQPRRDPGAQRALPRRGGVASAAARRATGARGCARASPGGRGVPDHGARGGLRGDGCGAPAGARGALPHGRVAPPPARQSRAARGQPDPQAEARILGCVILSSRCAPACRSAPSATSSSRPWRWSRSS